MKRPWKARVWFWRPQWRWLGWRTLSPFGRGGDEWDWHTIVLGWTVTGRVIIATRRCPQTGRCAEMESLARDWPWRPCYGGTRTSCEFEALEDDIYCSFHQVSEVD